MDGYEGCGVCCYPVLIKEVEGRRRPSGNDPEWFNVSDFQSDRDVGESSTFLFSVSDDPRKIEGIAVTAPE